jgi:hypothetical protein
MRGQFGVVCELGRYYGTDGVTKTLTITRRDMANERAEQQRRAAGYHCPQANVR